MKAVMQFRPSPGFKSALLSKAPEWLSISIIDETDKAAFAEASRDMDVLLHVLEPVTRDVLLNAPKLKFIQKIGVGVNTIDLTTAKERGIQVANMPGTNTQAVAEWVILSILNALRKPFFLHQETAKGNGWEIDSRVYDEVNELAGKTVGLIGYGAVAQRVAPILRALGAKLLYTSRSIKADALGEYTDLETLMKRADIISLHATYNESTHHLVNAQNLRLTKPGVIVVNTARGGLLDTNALLKGLNNGHVRAAVLDVFEQEPVPIDHPILKHPNV
ncbi:MAG TPA: NAD(P)-dependent oxidoreductase, partial [Pseudomonadales bacterium]|nr:NAD(P)-dependent oxidoreductase [Pseudomonadales bacterium]